MGGKKCIEKSCMLWYNANKLNRYLKKHSNKEINKYTKEV